METIGVPARDGYALGATIFSPDGEPRAVALIHPATAVPQKIYAGFAAYLAEHGFVALTYDYRGIGRSRPRSLKGFPARMRDWAEFDAEGVTTWARARWPSLPLVAVGHSVGGQAIGLCESSRHLSAAVLVTAQAAYWRLMKGFAEQLRVLALLRIIGPPLVALLGYMPAKRVDFGEDMPGPQFLEWGRWCMQKRYFFDDPTLAAPARYARVRIPVRAYGFTDDKWATPEAIALRSS